MQNKDRIRAYDRAYNQAHPERLKWKTKENKEVNVMTDHSKDQRLAELARQFVNPIDVHARGLEKTRAISVAGKLLHDAADMLTSFTVSERARRDAAVARAITIGVESSSALNYYNYHKYFGNYPENVRHACGAMNIYEATRDYCTDYERKLLYLAALDMPEGRQVTREEYRDLLKKPAPKTRPKHVVAEEPKMPIETIAQNPMDEYLLQSILARPDLLKLAINRAGLAAAPAIDLEAYGKQILHQHLMIEAQRSLNIKLKDAGLPEVVLPLQVFHHTA